MVLTMGIESEWWAWNLLVALTKWGVTGSAAEMQHIKPAGIAGGSSGVFAFVFAFAATFAGIWNGHRSRLLLTSRNCPNGLRD
jgi:hypothetical protein